jgi:cytochrome c oxidase subunit I
MRVAIPPASTVLHPRAAAFTQQASIIERRVGLLFAVTGVALIGVMGVLGLIMRLTQATVLGVSPAWFYRLMTLHGAGMITGALLVMMGGLWYVLHPTVPLRPGRMLVAYALALAGVVAVVIATLIGGFGAGWTFLPPLPFHPAGQWSVWSESLFFVGNLLIGASFCVFCVDVLEQTTATYGGLARTLGWHYLRGREQNAPPPQAIAATVVAIDGLISCAVGSTILVGLLGRTYDSKVGFDVLVTKNLVYFFGHSIANLSIYLGAAAIYVLVPRYAGRPYEASKVFVAGWMGSLVFIATAYSHHLYMDFVQPTWADIISAVASYGALLPVAVITIYSMTMLIWGSRYHWTLASTLLYIGFTGWAIGGVGAVIDSLIPINFRLHNTTWVVAHFHTYLILTVVVWALAFLAHLLEHDANRTSSRRVRTWTVALMLVGGYGLTGTWFAEGALGVPRRYAIQPPGTSNYSLVGAAFALVFAAGFLVFVFQLVRLARTARARRYHLVEHVDGWTGAHYLHRELVQIASPPVGALSTEAPLLIRKGVPLASPTQLGLGVVACVISLAAFFPRIVNASEISNRYHHLDHAGQFFTGALVGVLLGSQPAISRRLGDHSSIGLAAVLIAPTVMMLVMVPRFYEPLEPHPLEHALYHLAMAACGLATGVGATRLGLVTGRLMFVLSIGMPVMFAAAMK